MTRRQPSRVLSGALWASLWMGGWMLQPYFIRAAIDHGLVPGDRGALVRWSVAMASVALVSAAVGVLRHRALTLLRTDAAYRTVQVVTRHVAQLGAVLPRRVATGEVVTVGSTDVRHIGHAPGLVVRGVGALAALGLAAALVLTISPVLGACILLGVPAVSVAVGPLLGRLQGVETEYRTQQGELTARAGDIVAGLRVLRGIGGERLFADRYRQRSQALCAEGYRVGAVTSWVRTLAVGTPVLFVALITWLAARMAARATISVGDLVAVYAYAAILTTPVFFLIQSGHELIRALVAARRVVSLLNLRPAIDDRAEPRPRPTGPADLHDTESGVTVTAGTLLAVTSSHRPELAALADRLGRYVDADVRLGGVPLRELGLAEVRERILVAEEDAYLFAGTLREMLQPAQPVDHVHIERCVRAAAAEDVVDRLPDGLDTPVAAQARSLSGGQRQRVRLARALLADPEILILLEPTSAVDAHTEAAITDRLRAVRAGRTTVVATTSPLLLGRADQVAYLNRGRVAAVGTHEELLATFASYRALVLRGAETAEVAR